jgi:hypothetical protein
MAGRWKPWSTLFSDTLRRALDGTPFSQVFPPKCPPENPDADGRTHALRALRAYIAEIVFQIPEPGKQPKCFQLEPERILIEWPDSPTNLLFPRIEFNPGTGDYLPFGLTPVVFEQTRNRHGEGTVLTCAHAYREPLEVQVWATTRQQRRALVAGLEAMFSPLEETSGIRLRMPSFYGETVSFQPMRRMNVDDENAARRRRRADLTIEMEFNLVRLVNYVPLVPSGAQVEISVTDSNTEGS